MLKWNYSREEHLYILGIHTAWVKADAEINAALGLRLPTTVGLSTPDSMILGQSYTLNTNINGQDWDAAKYSAANVPSENGNEFVAGGQASLKVQAWALAIGNIGPYYLNRGFDYGNSFKTPFGPYEEFPIAEQILSPDQTHIKYIDPSSQLWAGIGLKIDPDLGSDKITANWSTGGDAMGNGTTEYNMPYSNYYFGPVTANDYSTMTDYATIKLSDFKYHFTICRLSLAANLHVGFSSFINLQTQYFDLYTYNCDWATGGYNLGIHQGTTANNVNKNIFVNRLTVVSPNGREKWERGTTHAIRWKYTGSPGTNVTIELLKNGVLNRTITPSTSVGTSGSGSYNWLINSTQTLGSDYKIRITSTTNLAYNDTSDSNFTISPISSITVVSPNNGENWTRGTTKTINWTSTGNPGAYVKIELLKAGVWKSTIISSTLNDGSNPWLIPVTLTPGTDYKVRITSTTNAAYTDTSDNNFTIPTPNISVITPNGGETWRRGTTQTIRWNSSGSPGAYVKIELLKPGGANKVIIASTLNDGSHPWLIPAIQAPGTDYKVRITSTTNVAYNDTSDNSFTILTPSFTVVSPNGSENWVRGTTKTIRWNSTESPGTYVKIELLKPGVANRVIVASTINDGSHPWLIPAGQTPGNDYKVKITSTINVSNNDTSDDLFTIPAPSFTVVSPNGSENWTRGTTQTIRWNSTESPGTYVKIELLKPGVANRVIVASTINDGSHPWLIPAAQAPGTDYKVKITSTINVSNNDTSDNDFTIPTPSITIVSPNGSENWTIGTLQTIRWNSTESPGTYVKIELLKPGVANKVLIASTLNDGSHPWLIPATQALGADYKIKITSMANLSNNDTSNSNFSIVPPKITVTSPNGGQTWIKGKAYPITWNYTGNPGTYVRIELLKNGLLNRTILASTPNDKSQSWTIPATQAPGTDYRIRVTSTNNAAYNDTSDGNFNISATIP